MASDSVIFGRDEIDLIVAFAGCSLDEKPGSNWVQDNGSLPDYVCRIAKAVKKTGKTTSQAIAIAVSRIKVWASGKGVDKDTQAKAAAALAEWEKLRAKAHAKSAAKDVKASRLRDGEILVLSDSVTSFNVDTVRQAWTKQTTAWRSKYQSLPPHMRPGGSYSGYGDNNDGGGDDGPPMTFIRELWTDHLIVCSDDDSSLFKVDYSVDTDGTVTFEPPVRVKVEYVAVDKQEMVGETISNSELRQLMASVGPCHASATDQVLLTITPRSTPLIELLSYRARTNVQKVLDAKLTGK